MLRWLRRAFIGLIVLGCLLGAGIFAALRDNPARPAIGERKIAEGPDARIHYFARGPAEASTVALVPSYARSASDFNELVADLNRAGYRTLAMQPRGIDGSELPDLQPTLHSYATDLAAVLDAESSHEPAVVVGHAYGNRIARMFASDYPDRTRALILLAAGGGKPTPTEIGNAILMAMLKVVPDARRREAIDLAFFAEGNAVPDSWLRGWYPVAGIAEQNASASTPYAEWKAGGGVPILVLDAEEDAVAGGAGRRLGELFPDRVEVRSIARSGHAILPERPDFVSAEVLRYLARPGQRP